MKIQARKCPFTGKVFEESKVKEYILHLQDVRIRQRAKRNEKRVKSTFHTWLAKERAQIKKIEDIPAWFMDNQRILMDAHNAGIHSQYSFCSDRDKFVIEDVFKNVTIKLRGTRGFSDLVSNSHVCPDKGVTNFCGEDGKPRSYPGWEVDIAGTLKRPRKLNSSYPYSMAINLAGIKTGSGGGGNENWGYDAKIFLDDWPGLQAQRDFELAEIARKKYELDQLNILRRLKGLTPLYSLPSDN